MEKIKGSVNSHIQLPRLILKSFSTVEHTTNENGFPEKHRMVYMIDMDGNISKQDIEEVNAEKGYYEDVIEKEVLATIEGAFGETRAKILSAISKAGSGNIVKLNITEEDVSIMKKYCALCIIRSEKLVEEISKKSLFMQFYQNAPQNIVAYMYANQPELVDYIISNHNVTLIINRLKDEQFILLQHGLIVYSHKDDKKLEIMMPIAPNVAILFTNEEVKIGNKLTILEVSAKHVSEFNRLAIRFEKLYNKKAVYAKRKCDLEKYKEFIKYA